MTVAFCTGMLCSLCVVLALVNELALLSNILKRSFSNLVEPSFAVALAVHHVTRCALPPSPAWGMRSPQLVHRLTSSLASRLAERSTALAASVAIDESENGPSSLSVARLCQALSRCRQAESDNPADIARQAATRERAWNSKRAKLVLEAEGE